MDAQASLLRFRPRSQNDGSERSEGECTPQVGLTSGSEGMREAQAYGIRFTGARRTLVCTRGLFFFFDHVAPNPHTPAPPQKPPWAGPAGPLDETGEMGAVFSEINRIWTPLYHLCHCFQYLASVNTNFLDRFDQSGVTCCN
jgi:hypothetical protein